MPVTVTITGRALGDLPISTQELMREIGTLAIRLIRTRTEQQIDVHGAPFQQLSDGYAKQKAKAGLSPVPDLTVSGRMLNDMTIVEVTDRSVSIGFLSTGGRAPRTGRRGPFQAETFIQRSRAVGAADKAFYHTEVGAGRSQVKREFFALSAGDEQAIERAVERYLDSILE